MDTRRETHHLLCKYVLLRFHFVFQTGDFGRLKTPLLIGEESILVESETYKSRLHIIVFFIFIRHPNFFLLLPLRFKLLLLFL